MSLSAPASRRRPIGAEYLGHGRTHFRVWAPASRTVTVVFDDGRSAALVPETDGYFSGTADARAGDRYQFRLDSGDRPYPDPASRFQPEGPHGWSEVIDPGAFDWTDAAWPGVRLDGQVLYELHVGTFTQEGTWQAAEGQLAELAALGITVIELMPIADFAGRFGWGYDGVNLWAPSHLYGHPDDLRRFVDRAHAAGLGVILDAVYNHLGPSGNYLAPFSPAYFTSRYVNDWGDAINFDGPDAGPVREYVTANAGHWIDEFHLDGLRLDATQQIFDRSGDNIMRQISAAVRDAGRARSTIVIAENEPQDTRLVRPVGEGGFGFDAVWNDDFHHSAIVALTGHSEAYYSNTNGDPQEFVSAAKYGYLYQGQYYHWQRGPRGTPSWGLRPAQFVNFLENHDQIANSARGLRPSALSSPGRWRAMTTLLLLLPGTPMLFQGQEFAASSPFLFFADHEAGLSEAITRGRAEFLSQFPGIVDFLANESLDDPAEQRTFERCKLDFRERTTHASAYALHRDLLALRRDEEAFRSQAAGGVDGAVLSERAFILRFFTPDHAADRVLIVNLGADLKRNAFAEPLLAPPVDCDWALQWSSEDVKYGGAGTRYLWPDSCWRIPGECALLLAPGPCLERRPGPPQQGPD